MTGSSFAQRSQLGLPFRFALAGMSVGAEGIARAFAYTPPATNSIPNPKNVVPAPNIVRSASGPKAAGMKHRPANATKQPIAINHALVLLVIPGAFSSQSECLLLAVGNASLVGQVRKLQMTKVF